MPKYVYPAIFTEDEGDFTIEFPDIGGCFASGFSLSDAMENAADVLAMTLCDYEKDGIPIPPATPMREVKVFDENSFTTLIYCDTENYLASTMVSEAEFSELMDM